MSMTEKDLIAEKLWQARLAGATLEGLSAPASVDDAYAIQQLAIDISQQQVNGIKIGATSQEIQQLLQVSEPFYGPMFSSYTRPSGSVVTVNEAQNPRVEPEFVVCLGKDLKAIANQPTTLETVENAVEWIAPAFEIVGTRVHGSCINESNRALFAIADYGSNLDMVVGERFTDWRKIDLTKAPVTLFINDKEVAAGHSGMSVTGNPLKLVAWLVDQPGLQQSGLAAGQLISCGTCTTVFPLADGDVVRADYGMLGSLDCRISDDS